MNHSKSNKITWRIRTFLVVVMAFEAYYTMIGSNHGPPFIRSVEVNLSVLLLWPSYSKLLPPLTSLPFS
jgi:hypothetical protein